MGLNVTNGDAGEPGGALDPLPRVDRAHREDAVLPEGLLGPQRPQLLPGPPGEPHDAGLAALAGHARDALDEIAPAQRDELRDPQTAVIEEADEGVVAGAVLDGLEQREDLLFAQNPLGECVLELGPRMAAPTLKGRYPILAANERSDFSARRRRARVAGAPRGRPRSAAGPRGRSSGGLCR